MVSPNFLEPRVKRVELFFDQLGKKLKYSPISKSNMSMGSNIKTQKVMETFLNKMKEKNV